MKKIAKATSIAFALLITSSAFATIDNKGYPGIGCVFDSGGVIGHFGGTIDNASTTTTLNVICPFVRDKQHGISGASMMVFDRHPTQDITCTIRSEFNTASGTFSNFMTASSSGFGSGIQQIFFPTALPTGDYYYANCSVPPVSSGQFSHIASFSIGETDDGT